MKPAWMDSMIRYVLNRMVDCYESTPDPITLYIPQKHENAESIYACHEAMKDLERAGMVRNYILRHYPMVLGAELTDFGLQRARELRKQKK